MKGNEKVIKALNGILTKELTAINQYFLHARMLEDWGLNKIGKIEYKASILEMKNADLIIKRVLFLEGLPNLQKLNKLRIGQNVKEIIEADIAVENESIPQLKEAIALCESEEDFATRDLLSGILKTEEDQVDWLETQQGLLEKLGEQNYIQSQMDSAE